MAGNEETDVAHAAKELADLALAMATVRKLSNKVDQLLAPLVREMKIMDWPMEYQAIMWEAVMLEAKARWENVVNEPNERIQAARAVVTELGRAIRALECEQDEAVSRLHQAIVDASDTPINDERQMMLEAA